MEPGTDDEAVIQALLTAEGERTRLVVEERGLPLDVLYLHGAGWQAHVEDLGRYLAGGQSMWKARWEEPTPAYQSLCLANKGSGERAIRSSAAAMIAPFGGSYRADASAPLSES
jgi:hypothetical protein